MANHKIPNMPNIPFNLITQSGFFRLKSTRRILYLALLLIVMAAVFFSAEPSHINTNLISNFFTTQPVMAQRITVGDAWRQVYQQLPNFPKENTYTNREGGKIAENNTLVGRMIQYHVYLKGRAPNYRLDWKLTLADYLGVNEVIYDTNYPGHELLRKNPLDGDKAAITKLSRRQRDTLVQALVNVFSPKKQ
ncbi:hypothetical protein [Calothrix sp. UHCC 0171]|uniref:hypothetical protein n=1 Tax=Calothrix sp. UHCC 0171 TaxID=3110245 RepID=UPI002B2148D1|nr:hypothetical protein [Calothrix sp. UHCC 0171]MEA5570676.1 hypothetical protein [Calothrix sp. UHCC 0171]